MRIRKDYEKLFSRLESQEPPAELFDKIISRIEKEKRFAAVRRRIFIFSFGMIASLAASFFAFQAMRAAFIESGFIEFFSLIFSDSGVILAYWQNFLLTLMESLPVMSTAAMLGAILAFLGSLRYLAREIKIILTPLNPANN